MLSLTHSTIFVHIPKTAGQSIEMAFLNDLNLEWEGRAPILLKPNSNPDLGPERLAHLYADEYIKNGFCSNDDFMKFFKFTVVRNPFERAVSEFNYREAHFQGFFTFKDYYESLKKDDHSDKWRHVCPQNRFIVSDGKILVDKILKFETLSTEWKSISECVFGYFNPLPRRNTSQKKYLTVEGLSRLDIDFIIETYAEDFVLFDYSIRNF